MIKPNELRIGNIIGWRTGFGGLIIGQAFEVHADKIAISSAVPEGEEGGQGFMKIAGIEPVPLTPEWLERCGFLAHKNGLLVANGVFIEHKPPRFVTLFYSDGTSYARPMGKHIEYLHQLQNLYFDLTGEELTIKEPA